MFSDRWSFPQLLFGGGGGDGGGGDGGGGGDAAAGGGDSGAGPGGGGDTGGGDTGGASSDTGGNTATAGGAGDLSTGGDGGTGGGGFGDTGGGGFGAGAADQSGAAQGVTGDAATGGGGFGDTGGFGGAGGFGDTGGGAPGGGDTGGFGAGAADQSGAAQGVTGDAATGGAPGGFGGLGEASAAGPGGFGDISGGGLSFGDFGDPGGLGGIGGLGAPSGAPEAAGPSAGALGPGGGVAGAFGDPSVSEALGPGGNTGTGGLLGAGASGSLASDLGINDIGSNLGNEGANQNPSGFTLADLGTIGTTPGGYGLLGQEAGLSEIGMGVPFGSTATPDTNAGMGQTGAAAIAGGGFGAGFGETSDPGMDAFGPSANLAAQSPTTDPGLLGVEGDVAMGQQLSDMLAAQPPASYSPIYGPEGGPIGPGIDLSPGTPPSYDINPETANPSLQFGLPGTNFTPENADPMGFAPGPPSTEVGGQFGNTGTPSDFGLATPKGDLSEPGPFGGPAAPITGSEAVNTGFSGLPFGSTATPVTNAAGGQTGAAAIAGGGFGAGFGETSDPGMNAFSQTANQSAVSPPANAGLAADFGDPGFSVADPSSPSITGINPTGGPTGATALAAPEGGVSNEDLNDAFSNFGAYNVSLDQTPTGQQGALNPGLLSEAQQAAQNIANQSPQGAVMPGFQAVPDNVGLTTLSPLGGTTPSQTTGLQGGVPTATVDQAAFLASDPHGLFNAQQAMTTATPATGTGMQGGAEPGATPVATTPSNQDSRGVATAPADTSGPSSVPSAPSSPSAPTGAPQVAAPTGAPPADQGTPAPAGAPPAQVASPSASPGAAPGAPTAAAGGAGPAPSGAPSGAAGTTAGDTGAVQPAAGAPGGAATGGAQPPIFQTPVDQFAAQAQQQAAATQPVSATNGAVASGGPAVVAQQIAQNTNNSIQAAVSNGSLSAANAQQVTAYQQNLTAQWQQILLNQGGGNPASNPQWPTIQTLIAKQVNARITQLGGHA